MSLRLITVLFSTFFVLTESYYSGCELPKPPTEIQLFETVAAFTFHKGYRVRGLRVFHCDTYVFDYLPKLYDGASRCMYLCQSRDDCRGAYFDANTKFCSLLRVASCDIRRNHEYMTQNLVFTNNPEHWHFSKRSACGY